MSDATQSSLPDDAIRAKIHLDLDKNLMVEAAAGTGKTTSMVTRMVNLIASGTCEINKLAAVTFTRKAAAELRERFQTQLRKEIQNERSQREKDHLQKAINTIESAFIGTYHSFCSLLLRERPVEFNVDPEFREIDEWEESRLKSESWQLFLDDLYSSNDRRRAKIEDLGLEPQDLKDCFFKFTGFMDVDQWPHAEPETFDLESAKRTIDEYIESVREIAPNFPSERGNDELMTRLEQIVLARDNADWSQDADFFQLAQLFNTTSIKTVLKCWADKTIAKTNRDRFHDLRQSVIEPALEWWYQVRYRFVIELMLGARDTYQRMRRASGGLDFQDLHALVADALKTQPKLRAYFQQRFTHLMVDEFQDTDPIQAEVVAFLTSENHTEEEWQKCLPRAGSLFVVGDPKQSIYRFRRADIVTYLQVRKLIEDSDGEVLELSTNFRSGDQVRDWNNRVFDSLIGQLSPPYSPEPVAMEAGRAEAIRGDHADVFRMPLPGDLRQAEVVPLEAEKIASYISNAIASGQNISRSQSQVAKGADGKARPGDFMIIAPNKKHLHAYAEALDRHGVANEIAGGNAFAEVEELKLLSQLLKAIEDPNNQVSYVALLRGPLFGFGDADLYELKKRGGSFSWTTPLPDSLPNDLLARFKEIQEKLGLYRRLLLALPYPSALDQIVDDIGLVARCAAQEEGDIVAGAFLKAIEFLRNRSWDFDSTQDLISDLDEMIADSETDSCSVIPLAGSRVRIMNLHKAKGLEAPVVFLANTYGKRTHKPNCHVDRTGQQSCGFLAIEKEIGTGFRRKRVPIAIPSTWEVYRSKEVQFEEAEDVRLLYVACTRAESQLVVSETPGDRYSFWSPLYPFLSIQKELPIPNELTETPNSIINNELPSLNEALGQIDESWNRLSMPSFSVNAAKTQAIENAHQRTSWTPSGEYGLRWGTAIHRLFETMAARPNADIDSTAARIVQQFELGNHRVEEVANAAKSLANSSVWKRAQESSRLFVEVPFEALDSNAEIPTVTRGVIDLCFEDQDGWVIVDYKTDDIGESDVQEAIELYRSQVEAYGRFWNSTTGYPVVKVGIYFTRLNQYLKL